MTFSDRLFSTHASCDIGPTLEIAGKASDVGHSFESVSSLLSHWTHRRLMQLQRKIAHDSEALKIFIFSDWNLGSDNFLDLNKVLLPSDE